MTDEAVSGTDCTTDEKEWRGCACVTSLQCVAGSVSSFLLLALGVVLGVQGQYK